MPPQSLSAFGPGAQPATLHLEAERYTARAILMINRARALVAGDRVAALDVLSARRTALTAHFTRYQRFKHCCIFDPAIEHGGASRKIIALTMKLDCIAMGERFGAYKTRCLGVTRAGWACYREDMLATTEQLIVELNAQLDGIQHIVLLADHDDRFAA